VKTKKIIAFLIFLSVYWVVSGAVLWWAYDFSSLIKGRAYSPSQALTLVAEMSCAITVLTAVIWILAMRSKIIRSGWRSAWHVVWQTALILAIYALVVLMRRQLWKPSQGINDWAMFFGYLNARFFSEVGGISFLMEVVPAAACISGALYFLQTFTVGATPADG
jgi:hypothetical protein